MLDFKYQDFVDLYQLKNQLDQRNQPPPYSLEQLSLTGRAGSGFAELSVRLQVLVRGADWVRVPLRLDQGLLHGEIQHRGPGEQMVRFEPDGEGYICWLHGPANTRHQLTLPMFVPLRAVGEESQLKLSLPRATASELKLTVPGRTMVARVSDGATLLSSIEREPKEGKASASTELTAIGLGADFQLSWHKAQSNAAADRPVLESFGSLAVRLDGRSITSQATLTVRSYGAPFDHVVVRLPPGSELAAGTGSTPGYLVTPVASRALSAGSSRLVDVRWHKKVSGPVEVRLNCLRPYDPSIDPGWCELSGFEVVGAKRQWGSIAVATEGEWQVLWGPSSQARQIDQLPDVSRRGEVAACFEYSWPSFSLTARLRPRETRVSVDPKYILLVDRDQVRLEGTLTYRVRGGKVSSLEIGMPGWELGEVGPDSLVAVGGAKVDPAGVATIPLSQPASGEFELRLAARQALAAGVHSLTVSLPRPRGRAVLPAAVAVVPADNVELLPNAAGMQGLVRQQTELPFALPERQQEAMYYRSTGTSATFAANLRVHSQRISADASSELAVGPATVEVQQRFAYLVAYEPVDHLVFSVPKVLAEGDRLKFLFEDKPLSPLVEADRLQDAGSPTSTLRIALPQPQIGRFEVLAQYTQPIAGSVGNQTATVSVPLPMPRDTEISSNRLHLKTAVTVRATPRPGPWTTADSPTGRTSLQSGIWLTAAGRIGEIGLDVRREVPAAAEALLVDRAWIQSWLTDSARQDRAVFQIATRRKVVEVSLPSGVAAGQVSVLLDGQRAEHHWLAEGRLSIPLSADGEQRLYVLELRYHFSAPRPPRGPMRLEFPRLGDDVWMRRLYWQLVLPPNEHVIVGPQGFNGEHFWSWHGYFWGRQPLLGQAQLETWAGVAPGTALPERDSVYLFSTLGTVDHAELRTAGRSWIVLFASGAALLVGLLLIYLPAARHPAGLLIWALALASVGMVAPEPALLFAQAASLGLALVLLAGLLDRMAARRRRTAKHPASSPSRLESASTRVPPRSAVVSSPSSTQTLPAAPPETRDGAP